MRVFGRRGATPDSMLEDTAMPTTKTKEKERSRVKEHLKAIEITDAGEPAVLALEDTDLSDVEAVELVDARGLAIPARPIIIQASGLYEWRFPVIRGPIPIPVPTIPI